MPKFLAEEKCRLRQVPSIALQFCCEAASRGVDQSFRLCLRSSISPAKLPAKTLDPPQTHAGSEQRDCYCGLDGSTGTSTATSDVPPGICGRCDVCGHPGHIRHFPGPAPVTGTWCDIHFRRAAWPHPLGHYGRWLYTGAVLALALIAIALMARRWRTNPMELFAAAVHTVIDELESAGHEIVEAEFDASFTPNVVASKDGELLFVLVQVLLGPHIADFSESVFHSEIVPFAESVSSHPKASTVAAHAAQHHARAAFALICMLPTDESDEDGDPAYMGRAFPLRGVDSSGKLTPFVQ